MLLGNLHCWWNFGRGTYLFAARKHTAIRSVNFMLKSKVKRVSSKVADNKIHVSWT